MLGFNSYYFAIIPFTSIVIREGAAQINTPTFSVPCPQDDKHGDSVLQTISTYSTVEYV